jgi:endonuclease/exonuclease/phosphatase family metal-dependent hydrolase
VSFNIEYALEMKRAIRVLRSDADLREADVMLLQEMDARGAKMAADSFGMHYVYYPAIYNNYARKDVGNAILSRWPIVSDAKLILPSHSRYAKTQRIATAATIDFAGQAIRVYSTHLGTPADLGHAGRVAQVQFILRDAAEHERVIFGGDMNSRDIGQLVADSGYAWPTQTIPRSNSFGRIDHVFFEGSSRRGRASGGNCEHSAGHQRSPADLGAGRSVAELNYWPE